MMAHPGKKLNFMGNEFGQLREWDESREQDWDILKYPLHDAFHRYMIELNRIGQENDAFWHDYDPENFKWLDCHQEERCIYAIKRKGKNKNFIAIFNFSDEEQEDYELDTEEEGKLSVILDTDWDEYGGNTKKKKTLPDACDAGPAAVFGDFADELGDRKGTPGAERYFCFRARFRSAKNAAVLSSVIPQALSPH